MPLLSRRYSNNRTQGLADTKQITTLRTAVFVSCELEAVKKNTSFGELQKNWLAIKIKTQFSDVPQFRISNVFFVFINYFHYFLYMKMLSPLLHPPAVFRIHFTLIW